MNNELEDDEPLPLDIQPLDKLFRAIFGSKLNKAPVKASQTEYVDTPASLKDSSEIEGEIDPKAIRKSDQTFGPYYIQKVLGVGGYGVVYLATDLGNGLRVALKLPREDRDFSPQSFRRFQKEPKLLKKLDHPSIVRLIDEGEIENTFFIATEYQDGLDLHEWMLKNRDKINEKLVIDWGLKLTDALSHAYSCGVVHRDLKPRNIIVVETKTVDGEAGESKIELTPKITDFGLAFSFHESFSGSTASGAIVGTLGYLPPEQVMSGKKLADIRVDIYSLGIILAELAQGRSLIKPANLIDYILEYNRNEETVDLRSIKQNVSSGLYSILRKCVESKPERRYQTPHELYLDLERLKNGNPLHFKRSDSRENLRRIVRRNPMISTGVVVSFLSLIVLSTTQFFNQKRMGRLNADLKAANIEVNNKNSDLIVANLAIKKVRRISNDLPTTQRFGSVLMSCVTIDWSRYMISLTKH
jgi:serine/threonine protein kinase